MIVKNNAEIKFEFTSFTQPFHRLLQHQSQLIQLQGLVQTKKTKCTINQSFTSGQPIAASYPAETTIKSG